MYHINIILFHWIKGHNILWYNFQKRRIYTWALTENLFLELKLFRKGLFQLRPFLKILCSLINLSKVTQVHKLVNKTKRKRKKEKVSILFAVFCPHCVNKPCQQYFYMFCLDFSFLCNLRNMFCIFFFDVTILGKATKKGVGYGSS